MGILHDRITARMVRELQGVQDGERVLHVKVNNISRSFDDCVSVTLVVVEGPLDGVEFDKDFDYQE